MTEHTPVESMFDEYDDGDTSPICGFCGVSALPAETPGQPPSCENPDCTAFGESLGSDA